MTPLTIIDSRSPDWEKRVAERFDSGRNFIVRLQYPAKELPELCSLLQTSKDFCPASLQKWAVYAVRDLLEPEQVHELLDALEQGEAGFFVEQIKLRANRPPKVGPYLVYCELGGILSEHDNIETAKKSLIEHFQCCIPSRNYPLAGIYKWDGKRWTKTNIAF